MPEMNADAFSFILRHVASTVEMVLGFLLGMIESEEVQRLEDLEVHQHSIKEMSMED